MISLNPIPIEIGLNRQLVNAFRASETHPHKPGIGNALA